MAASIERPHHNASGDEKGGLRSHVLYTVQMDSAASIAELLSTSPTSLPEGPSIYEETKFPLPLQAAKIQSSPSRQGSPVTSKKHLINYFLRVLRRLKFSLHPDSNRSSYELESMDSQNPVFEIISTQGELRASLKLLSEKTGSQSYLDDPSLEYDSSLNTSAHSARRDTWFPTSCSTDARSPYSMLMLAVNTRSAKQCACLRPLILPKIVMYKAEHALATAPRRYLRPLLLPQRIAMRTPRPPPLVQKDP